MGYAAPCETAARRYRLDAWNPRSAVAAATAHPPADVGHEYTSHEEPWAVKRWINLDDLHAELPSISSLSLPEAQFLILGCSGRRKKLSSFWNTKSSPLVSWFSFCHEQKWRRQNEKSKIRNWHAEVRVPWISYFQFVHFI